MQNLDTDAVMSLGWCLGKEVRIIWKARRAGILICQPVFGFEKVDLVFEKNDHIFILES